VAQLMFDVQRTAELLQAYSAFTGSRPAGVDGVSAYLFLTKAANHVVLCDVAPSHSTANSPPANLDAFREMISPFFALEPVDSIIRSMTLPELNSMSDEGNSAGSMYAWSRSTFVPHLAPQLVDALCTARSALPVHAAAVEIMHVGGAIALKLPSDSAFVHRCACHTHASCCYYTCHSHTLVLPCLLHTPPVHCAVCTSVCRVRAYWAVTCFQAELLRDSSNHIVVQPNNCCA
jgi:hypothetical protein